MRGKPGLFLSVWSQRVRHDSDKNKMVMWKLGKYRTKLHIVTLYFAIFK